MIIDKLGNIFVNDKEVFDLIYQYKSIYDLNISNQNTIDKINNIISENCDDIKKLSSNQVFNVSIESYDKENQSQWFLPNEYLNFDIENYLISLCKNEVELVRVKEEIDLYKSYNLLPVLIYLKYLIDHFRKHNIVWGVGRGSSVSSYCLYLLGVHKIDSIKYNLDIKEFIK